MGGTTITTIAISVCQFRVTRTTSITKYIQHSQQAHKKRDR